jgi:hypothetical protein
VSLFGKGCKEGVIGHVTEYYGTIWTLSEEEREKMEPV